MGDAEVMGASGQGEAQEAASASAGAARPAFTYAPHPYVGGRTPALRALAAWHMRWPGAPRVIVVTGAPGSGRSRLIAGFLMLCDPDYRKRLPLDDLDPATVPPDLPPPAAPNPRGLTAAQTLRLLADHADLTAGETADTLPELTAELTTHLATREEPLMVVVPDCSPTPTRSSCAPPWKPSPSTNCAPRPVRTCARPRCSPAPRPRPPCAPHSWNPRSSRTACCRTRRPCTAWA